jgi:glycosyltransferase involved in cell wall biosynthesis
VVRISCLTKFWAFALAEQLQRTNHLSKLYTGFSGQSNLVIGKYIKRKDFEKIDSSNLKNFYHIAVLAKLFNHPNFTLDLFDFAVSKNLQSDPDFSTFIGWSGSSLKSLRVAKNMGKKVILERGSSHILYQNKILNEEYSRFGISFNINKKTILTELKEYEEADYIAVPSNFVKNSFLDYGIDEKKIFLNPYGASDLFLSEKRSTDKFTILYLGTLNIRKGLFYLFEALNNLKIPIDKYEVWFIGSISNEIKPFIKKFSKSNWIFWGHIYRIICHRRCYIRILSWAAH